MASSELLATPTPTPMEHECPYDTRLEWYIRNVGARGIASANFIRKEIESIHTTAGTCPPTHVDNGPTREWESIVDYTRI